MKTHDFKGYQFTHSVAKCEYAYYSYVNSSAAYLRDVYDSWSSKKQDAYEYCRTMYLNLDGYNFTIVSYSQYFFAVGFMFPDPDTGETMFAYITHANNYYATKNEILDRIQSYNQQF